MSPSNKIFSFNYPFYDNDKKEEKNEEKFVQMLNAVEWSDTALRRMLPAMEESELQIAKAYILDKIRTKETFEV